MNSLPFREHQRWKISDEEVIRKVLAGEKAFFELLMRRYNQKLFRVVAGYLSNKEDVADVMQETYLKAYQKLDQYKFKATFSTWLIRIAINEALGKNRKDSKYVKFNSDTDEFQSKIIELPTAVNQNPEHQLIHAETKIMLEKAILNLSAKYRIVYMLREVEGMSITEIGECLNLSSVNVKVRLFRSRKMIREELYRLSATSDPFEFGFKHCDALVNKVLKAI
ncbi:RNA polymerase sigma factor [Muriicola sp. Z0-33]|uniref:RNA polymerase sigma factor n=1 Tax=Muriicola sp. Z0-33 TaxID=2816957 RepID=UPI002237D71C|nr:RNA polymerase sigma factor [Muriicola sp. Z0-33]MCW5517070.1 RNA polymerase sigma factor [Muriicola sp. Z0-33]